MWFKLKVVTPNNPWQKGQLVETVEGVNTPVLERLVTDNAPSKDELAAGVDDPDSADEGPGGGGAGGRIFLKQYQMYQLDIAR